MDKIEIENEGISSHFPMGQKTQNIPNGFAGKVCSKNLLFPRIYKRYTVPIMNAMEMFVPVLTLNVQLLYRF